MPNATTWTGVTVAIESARGGALTITAITKANPGVASSTGHGLLDGDYVYLDVTGMAEVDGRVFRVAGKTTDTFQLEGENTTSYGTFVSGSAYKITFGTTLATATSLSGAGGEFSMLDITTITDTIQKQMPGIATAPAYTFDNLWDVSDAGLVALKAASTTKSEKCVRFTFSNAQKVCFAGYVGATLLPLGSSGEVVKTPTVITMSGAPTVYST